ncbi:vWA domain-containing protein [Hoeflea poritis]|uniref:VWA domain-containing protein n=1 Tax=Hoeflea poritis TaxID=2993659 RepID=A0ABT4VT44_9HYPH|nr:VWA domain-containing protein [Hoeflea poritis]MDA4847237.1 VWA domain-containing protein [Hoeflea poritis]
MAAGTDRATNAPLTDRIIGFVDHLRANGFTVGTQESGRIAAYLAEHPLPQLPRIRLELKILLTGNRDEWLRFDELFEAYFVASGRERTHIRRTTSPHVKNPLRHAPVWREHLADTNAGSDAPQIESDHAGDVSGEATGRLIAAKQSVDRKTDLKHIVDPDEMRAAEDLALRLAKAMRYRLSRRHRAARHGRRIDLRRTIRRALPRGGEPIELFRRTTPDRPVHIIVFLDVSGSMKHYSRFFLQFVKGLVCSWMQSDAFVFHTRLIRVTDAVRDRNSARAMTRLALMAEGFGGGTKLGESIATFNRTYARRLTNSRTVAIILSDGYDTGSADELAAELARLKRHVRRLVWLNPLLGWQSYEPVTAAMQAARPYIDHFAAANSLESLAAIEPQLAQL